MISRFWFLLGAIGYGVFLSVVPVAEVSANGVVYPVWEHRVASSTLVMLTSPFPPSTGSLHIALQLDSIQGDGSAVDINTPIVLTISPGQGVYETESVLQPEELKLYAGALGQYHANVFIDRPGEWIFTVDLIVEGEEYRIVKELTLVEAQVPKVPLLTSAFAVLVFSSAYLAWWIRSRKRSVG